MQKDFDDEKFHGREEYNMFEVELKWEKPVHIKDMINNRGKYSLKGLYLFLVGKSFDRLALYYIGKTENIGKRIDDHYKRYLSGSYWVPKSIDEFSEKVFEYYRLMTREECRQKFYMPGESECMKEAASELMSMTYMTYAVPDINDGIDLEDIEAILIASVLKRNKLPSNGWIGDGKTKIPIYDYKIHNSFDPSIEASLFQ